MYKKRQKLAKELTRSESERSFSLDPNEYDQTNIDIDEHDPLENEDQANVLETFKPPPFKKQKKGPLGMAYTPIQVGYRENIMSTSLEAKGFTYPNYDKDIEKMLPKKIDWTPLSEIVRGQMRDILSSNYRKTMMHIAGSSSEGPDDETIALGQELLKPIATQIDKMLSLTLFPKKVDSKLLDSDLPAIIRDMRKRLKNDVELAAELTVKVEEKKDELAVKQAILDDLVEKTRQAKEEQLKYPHRVLFEDPEDYVQMLMRYPSSGDY